MKLDVDASCCWWWCYSSSCAWHLWEETGAQQREKKEGHTRQSDKSSRTLASKQKRWFQVMVESGTVRDATELVMTSESWDSEWRLPHSWISSAFGLCSQWEGRESGKRKETISNLNSKQQQKRHSAARKRSRTEKCQTESIWESREWFSRQKNRRRSQHQRKTPPIPDKFWKTKNETRKYQSNEKDRTENEARTRPNATSFKKKSKENARSKNRDRDVWLDLGRSWRIQNTTRENGKESWKRGGRRRKMKRKERHNIMLRKIKPASQWFQYKHTSSARPAIT